MRVYEIVLEGTKRLARKRQEIFLRVRNRISTPQEMDFADQKTTLEEARNIRKTLPIEA